MYSKHDNVLIKTQEQELGYRIVHKKTRGYLLIDDMVEAKRIITNLLAEGVEVYESEDDFYAKYPPLTSEDIKKNSMEFWRDVPKEMWSQEVIDYFDKNK